MKATEPEHEMNFRITIVDSSNELIEALASEFRHEPQVTVKKGNLLSVRADTLLAPGNSFGDMGGGIDKAIDDHFNGQIQPAVVSAISEHRLGELPVGDALVIPLPLKHLQHLVVAPTMRVPGNVAGTINAYLALRGALVAVAIHNKNSPSPIKSMACPGLCTGVGGMPFAEAARQMLAAYRNIAHGLWREVRHPAMAPLALEGG